MPLGGESIIPIDVRIIAATNQNLSKMVEEGRFRSDLYYRLNILRIHMPTLAERKEDIPLLADKLLQKMQDINPNLKSITKEAKLFLSNCKWPGNIRQFVNMMERIMLLTDGDTITKQDVINAYEDDKEVFISNEKGIIESRESINTSDKNLAQMEIDLLRKVLVEENYNYTKAAKRLGIHRKLKNK
jgi:transcriptional regulator with PAS, ATPase and Fis domain